MKAKALPFIIFAAGIALPLSSHAAVITWGSATAITASTDIQSAGVTGLAGADFGLTTGTTTAINNGSVDVDFKSLSTGQSEVLANGVTVAVTDFNFTNAAGNGTIGGAFGTILGRHMGSFSGVPTVTLSGLTNGTRYQIQIFAMGGDTQTVNITGGPGLSVGGGNNPGNSSGFGQYAVGTFTADGPTQSITIGGSEPVLNALTVGTIPEPSVTLLGGIGLLGLMRRRRLK
jgi:hypothetical protein